MLHSLVWTAAWIAFTAGFASGQDLVRWDLVTDNAHPTRNDATATVTLWAQWKPTEIGLGGGAMQIHLSEKSEADTLELAVSESGYNEEDFLGRHPRLRMFDRGDPFVEHLGPGEWLITAYYGGIEFGQMPPAFNDCFMDSNPVPVIRFELTVTDFEAWRQIQIHTIHFLTSIYIDEFGASRRYKNQIAALDVVPCPADCDGDGNLNTRDLICYLNLLNDADPAADCNGDAIVNTLDFLCFLDAYQQC